MLWLNDPVAHLTSPDRLLFVLQTGAVEGFIYGITNDGRHVEAICIGRDHDEIVAAREDWMHGDKFGVVHGYPGKPLSEWLKAERAFRALKS